MKRITRLTESDLHRIVKESVKRVLREGFTKPSNWKDTEFKGTYTDEDGALYMPDDDFDNETTVDNESTLQSLKNLSENKIFVELLKWGVIKLRAEHYENADIDKMLDQKIFSSIEEAADFVNSSREQTYIYVDGGPECLNIYDIA